MTEIESENISGWYNPNHPDADWSGYIKPCESRKHPIGIAPAMRVQIGCSEESGYVPNDDAATHEWSKPGRRIRSNNIGNDKSTTRSTSLIGQVEVDTSNSWETEAQAAWGVSNNNNTTTKLDQLTFAGRAMHVRSKKSATPAFENVKPYNNEIASQLRYTENPYLLCDRNLKRSEISDVNFRNDGSDMANLVGYRSHHHGGTTAASAHCLLSNLSKEMTESIISNDSASMKSKAFSFSGGLGGIGGAPFATDANLPTDPYISSDGDRRKDLLLENFSSATPGYTGKRTFI